MTIEIPLSRGLFAKIDEEDYPRIRVHKWSVCRTNSGFVYAVTSKQLKGVRKFPKMHRFIMCAQPGEVVDHINHDTLDNQKSNLRITDSAGNNKNRRPVSFTCPLCGHVT